MKVNILPLLRGEKDRIPFSLRTDIASVTPDVVSGTAETVGAVYSEAGRIVLEADIVMDINAVCGRCGEETNHKPETRISRTVTDGSSEDDPDCIAADGNGDVDIDEAVFDAVLLSMPMRFLCREDCRGLCPVCGVNLNDSSCSCVAETPDPRLAKLREYLENNK